MPRPAANPQGPSGAGARERPTGVRHRASEVPILTLLLPLLAAAGPDEDAVIGAATEALRSGDAERALGVTRNVYADPRIATLHLAASLQIAHPLETAVTCEGLIRMVLSTWPDSREIARTCGWHLVATRTRKDLAVSAARHLAAADPYDTNARGLLLAAQAVDELPVRRWAPPTRTRGDGQIRARRKRDFVYLWKYLRPEDGDVTVEATYTTTPSRGVAQARAGTHATLYLREHEVVLAGWRATARIGDDGGLPRASAHQLHGGYRLTIYPRWPMQLDGSLILGKGRDEGMIRLRGERVGLGVFSLDAAAAWTPWGHHLAAQAGWAVTFEGLATVDLRAEGQLGTGGPRGLVKLGVTRWIGHVGLRLDGQAGRAARPIGDRSLFEDLPGLEGHGGSFAVQGRLTEHVSVRAMLGVKALHPGFGEAGAVAGQVGVAVTGGW
jgi:hypothetical protein